MAGRITLINSVLTSLPIFWFSFYKAPASVLKSIDKIRSRFLWGGSEEKSKIHWIKRDKVCMSKEDGGLGVKRIEEFNLALLTKWKWRIFEYHKSLWKDTLKARYGSI
ncbi:unnamed protein product [Lathyrus sativus]|nr:unnamed protein product [Lathyrus sativus]